MLINTFIVVFYLCLQVASSQISCRTPNGEISYCVSIYECPHFLHIIAKLTPQMTKFFRESRCNYDNDVKVCCGSFVNYEDETEPNVECGRIYGDKYGGVKQSNILRINEHPWAALIEYRNNETSTGHHCGAVLIDKNYALTAAHCVSGDILRKYGNVFQIRLGEYDRSTEKDCVDLINDSHACYNNHQNIRISNITIHPKYKYINGSYLNDIAIIKFANPATFSDFIRPVCLSTESISHAGMEYSVVGWGINENNKGQILKHEVKAFAFQNGPCTKMSSTNITLNSSQFCAVKSGEQEKDKYCGDAGGAIVKYNKTEGLYHLQGIESFSFSQNNDLTNYIIVYSNIYDYSEWIMEKTSL